MLKKINDEVIIADHGRRIAKLCDDVDVLSQRLLALERRVATIENSLAELRKFCYRLDLVRPVFKTDDR
ncbi:MAG: hypothetical protein QW835_01670 [Candidatus Hadarchaeum sp.]|uniref:hypothetical protein n=1 Tax=Candidatus Hadarchaeum sp. TaxID=2883567 RepID=UPI0031802BE5